MEFYHWWRCESLSVIHELMKFVLKFDDEISMDPNEISDVYYVDFDDMFHC